MSHLAPFLRIPLHHARRSMRAATNFVQTAANRQTRIPANQSFTTEHLLTNQNIILPTRCYCSNAAINQDDEHSALYEKILKSTRRGLQKRYRDRKDDIIGLIESLRRLTLSKYDITWLVSDTPEILQHTQAFYERASWLSEQGFKGTELATLLYNDPSVLQMDRKVVLGSFDKLRNFGYSEGRIQKLLAKHPDLFYVSSETLGLRYKQLMTLFRKGEVMTYAYDLPAILTCDWDDLMEKVIYISQDMGLDQGHMLRSDALGCPLLYIKTRHLFLQRAGLYQKPDKRGITQIENPPLADITDTPDDIFAQDIAGISVGEFLAFKEIMRIESEAATWDEAGVEEESDEDSDDEPGFNSKWL